MLTVAFPVLLLPSKFLVILQNSGNRRAVFPLQARNLCQTVFNGLQAGRVDVHMLPVGQQATRHFLNEIVTLLQVSLEVLLAGIETGQLGQLLQGGSERGQG